MCVLLCVPGQCCGGVVCVTVCYCVKVVVVLCVCVCIAADTMCRMARILTSCNTVYKIKTHKHAKYIAFHNLAGSAIL